MICRSAELVDGGAGVRFEVQTADGPAPAFVVRAGGQPRAYVNRCMHIGVELDWLPGEFFDDSGLYLICAAHGATYEPASGRCVRGPCKGRSLIPITVVERDGEVVLE